MEDTDINNSMHWYHQESNQAPPDTPSGAKKNEPTVTTANKYVANETQKHKLFPIQEMLDIIQREEDRIRQISAEFDESERLRKRSRARLNKPGFTVV